jgi:hypothetical protein
MTIASLETWRRNGLGLLSKGLHNIALAKSFKGFHAFSKKGSIEPFLF